MAPQDWWREAVIYQIYPRSFADSDGDGVGDLPGIRERLPYLRDLGVDAVWLSPFYASPQADAGYDVADYRAVDPVFGDLGDAAGLLADAHALGLRVLVDVVPNHCSDHHAWFRRALAEGPGSPARARFHFRDGRGPHGELPPNDWESVFGGPAWTRITEPDGRPGQWYLHLFAPEQPDFDWQSRAVRDEFRTVLRFWLDLGVDGFRVDAAHGLIKEAGLPDTGHGGQVGLLETRPTPYFDQDAVHAVYRDWRRVLAEYGPDRIAVAEAWTRTVQRAARYVRPDELHQAFNFSYLTAGWDAAELRTVAAETLAALGAVGAPATWVLSNHDVVRHTTRLGGGVRRARAATLLMLALPGAAYLYQGEELGLPEVTDLPDAVRQDPAFARGGREGGGQEGRRDGCRVPIPWSGTAPPYGFGPRPGGPSWLPQPAEWAELSVAAQRGDPSTTLEFYRSALRIRREQPALGAAPAAPAGAPGGGVRDVPDGGTDAPGGAGGCADPTGKDTGDAGARDASAALCWTEAPEGVLAFRRDRGTGGVLVAANTRQEAVRIALPPHAELLIASSEPPTRTGGPGGGNGTAQAVLPGDCTAWWRV